MKRRTPHQYNPPPSAQHQTNTNTDTNTTSSSSTLSSSFIENNTSTFDCNQSNKNTMSAPSKEKLHHHHHHHHHRFHQQQMNATDPNISSSTSVLNASNATSSVLMSDSNANYDAGISNNAASMDDDPNQKLRSTKLMMANHPSNNLLRRWGHNIRTGTAETIRSIFSSKVDNKEEGGMGDNGIDFEGQTTLQEQHSDFFNYALLIVLYTLQGIPMGLSASIPFLLQDKVRQLTQVGTAAAAAAAAASSAAAAAAGTTTATVAAASAANTAAATQAAYNANAIFALCSWPFSLKLLWAPIVDACNLLPFLKTSSSSTTTTSRTTTSSIASIFGGRRKNWLIPVQLLAGIMMVFGAPFVESQLVFDANGGAGAASTTMNVKGVTLYFMSLYFLMATQDIAVDGWALTLLQPKNRGKGPICNSIGQNIGYFLSFVGFLALNDITASETWWRPLLRLKSDPTCGIVSLGGFLKTMGYFMLITTILVAFLKREGVPPSSSSSPSSSSMQQEQGGQQQNQAGPTTISYGNDGTTMDGDDDDAELDASQIGLKETYQRLWAVCQLPSVRWLFLLLVTYRLPTALSDNVKFLKAVEYGMSKSTTALLSPTIILPLGILVPLIAHKVWPSNPLQQFLRAYQVRVTIIPLLDLWMLYAVQQHASSSSSSSSSYYFWSYWFPIIVSTAGQAICNSLQFNAQMIFFASRVDPAIGGSYMTLLNTAANLGGTWPSSFIMKLVSLLSSTRGTSSAGGDADATAYNNGNYNHDAGSESTNTMTTNFISRRLSFLFGNTNNNDTNDPYMGLQVILSLLGIIWLWTLGPKLQHLSHLPDDAWRTHWLEDHQQPSQDQQQQSSNINNNTYSSKKNDNDYYASTSSTRMTPAAGISSSTSSASVSPNMQHIPTPSTTTTATMSSSIPRQRVFHGGTTTSNTTKSSSSLSSSSNTLDVEDLESGVVDVSGWMNRHNTTTTRTFTKDK